MQATPGEARRTSSLATTTALLLQLLEQLTGKAGWQARQIHLFGFSQGGTAALQLARQYKGRLGSVVAVAGSLLPEDADMIKAGSSAATSWQAAGDARRSSAAGAVQQERTPVLITHGDRDDVVARRDVEATVAVLQAAGCDAALHNLPGKGHGMISGAAEAQALMKFWSQHLLARPADPGFMPVG
jgi:predicted esterase